MKKEIIGKKEKGNENGRMVIGVVYGIFVFCVLWSLLCREWILIFGNRDGFGDWDMGIE